MIKFENVNVTMQGKRILSDVNLEIQDGEFVLICGESGCGKTTMTKLINGLIPHFVRDVSVDGTITVYGKNVAEMPMYEIAELVGSVFQNPRTQFCQAVMSGKKMLIFDEPTSGLDFRHMCQVEKMMKRLAEEKYIIIVVTHDYEFLNRACKRYIRINS